MLSDPLFLTMIQQHCKLQTQLTFSFISNNIYLLHVRLLSGSNSKMTNIHPLPPEEFSMYKNRNRMKRNKQDKESNITNAIGISVSDILLNQPKFPVLLLILSYIFVCVGGAFGGCLCRGAGLEIRWQCTEAGSNPPQCGSPHVVRLGSKQLYPLILLSSPWLVFEMYSCSAAQASWVLGFQVSVTRPGSPTFKYSVPGE